MTNTISYKGFDLSVFLYGRLNIGIAPAGERKAPGAPSGLLIIILTRNKPKFRISKNQFIPAGSGDSVFSYFRLPESLFFKDTQHIIGL